MTKESRKLTDAEVKALAESFDMTPKQFMSSIKAAESMLKKNEGGPIVKKKMNKGLTALKKEAPEVVKKMGYKKGGSLKKMNVGGMMPTQERKINPSTGMAMNKGGMTDMRKSGMFYGGGMAKKSKMMYGGMAKKK